MWLGFDCSLDVMKTVSTTVLSALILAACAAMPCQAGDWGEKAPAYEEVEYSVDTWEYTLAPYAFLPAISGSIGVGPISADFSPNFGDVLSSLDFAMMISFQARKGQFAFMNDFIYAGLSPGAIRPGQVYNNVAMQLDMFVYTGVGTFRIVDEPDFFLEVGGGARYLYSRSELSISSSVGAPFLNSRSAAHVWDGVAALRLGYSFSDRWIMRAYGDIGGGTSDRTWQAVVSLGYVMSERTTAFLGYRYLDYKFSEGATSLDLSMSGPQLGVAIKF